MRADKVYLVGFMAAGKTTLARALGARLHWRNEDTDALIERREGMTVADIFAQRGESGFRIAEQAALRALLPARRIVIATGGGTFAVPDNRDVINSDGVSIWLDVSLQRVIERLPADGRRPLAADQHVLEKLFLARQSAYRQAHVHLDADRAQIGELVDQVSDWLARHTHAERR